MKTTPEIEAEVVRLHYAEHWPVGTIATQLEVHPDVVRRVLGLGEPRAPSQMRPRIVDPYRTFIDDTLYRYPKLLATRLYDMVRERGYRGSVRTLREYVALVRPRPKREAFLVTETLPGEQAQVDWAYVGKVAVPGGERGLWVFVMVLAHSRAMWGEFVIDLSVHSLCRSLVRGAAALGGAPRQWLFDNPKIVVLERVGTAVRFHPTLLALCAAMRVEPKLCAVRKPRHKAKVEVGVQIVERWILACLRNQTFFSLAELNERIRELLDVLNDRVMRRYGVSRRALFERLDQPALRRLPAERLIPGEWKKVTPHIDYHVDVEHHFYSVPYQLVGEELWARYTALTVEVFHKTQRVSSHVRSYERGRHTTNPEHLPPRHRKHGEWTPERLVRWAGQSGVNIASLFDRILRTRRHPEHGYRSCLGIMRLEKKYGAERVDAACARVLAVGGLSYKHVDSVLRNGLDRVVVTAATEEPLPDHENVRGPGYYH